MGKISVLYMYKVLVNILTTFQYRACYSVCFGIYWILPTWLNFYVEAFPNKIIDYIILKYAKHEPLKAG